MHYAGIWGGKGQGKTFQTELIFRAMGVEPVIMSAGELESEKAGEEALELYMCLCALLLSYFAKLMFRCYSLFCVHMNFIPKMLKTNHDHDVGNI